MISWSPDDVRLEAMKTTVNSCQRLTKRPFKFIVIDNGLEKQTEWLKQQDIDVLITPGQNLGVGASRNLGAKHANTKYIVFLDNDILLFENWLNECISVLEKYPDEKLIATPRRSHPMKFKKHCVGTLDGYLLFNRAAGQALVFRRKDYNLIGPWSLRSNTGGEYCRRVRANGFLYVWKHGWNSKHICRKPSYNYHNQLVNGQWIKESKT